VPLEDRVPPIYGGGVMQGAVQPTPAAAALLADLAPT
jgi:hypothetical protein